jgi:hypothetical protein
MNWRRLARRHKVAGRGTRRFTWDVIHQDRGVLCLERLPRSAPPHRIWFVLSALWLALMTAMIVENYGHLSSNFGDLTGYSLALVVATYVIGPPIVLCDRLNAGLDWSGLQAVGH